MISTRYYMSHVLMMCRHLLHVYKNVMNVHCTSRRLCTSSIAGTSGMSMSMLKRPLRVYVGVSGGVDSSVAALLLRDAGHDVTCVFMKNWDADEETGSAVCDAELDCNDARAISQQLSLPFITVNFVKEYWLRVFERILASYSEGLTPNPDYLCNHEIKFEAFRNYALNAGADVIATGHYARIVQASSNDDFWKIGDLKLGIATDTTKDQSYFLAGLPQTTLHHVLFPLGSLKKSKVREIAMAADLVTAKKKESMGICFVGRRRKFKTFLLQYLEAKQGNFVDEDTGKTLGHHEGAFLYANGQGARIGGVPRPYYVTHRNIDSNEVFVSTNHDHKNLLSRNVRVGPFLWTTSAPSVSSFECLARYRHLQQLFPVSVHVDGDCIDVTSVSTMRAVSPGQLLALYRNDTCLGAGYIINANPLDLSSPSSSSSVNHNNIIIQ